jgi:cobalt/nickel transport system ATP-binding protein
MLKRYILEAEGLEFYYPDGTKALDGLDIKIEQGKKIALVGSNGAGKSTLFLHFNGIFQPANGRIKYKGTELRYKRQDLATLRKEIGVVFQDPDSQLFSASVFQEISFGPMNLELDVSEVEHRVNTSLHQMGIEALKDKPTHFLSFGQKKRVCIADILAMEPEVIVFDEPTDSLDPVHADEMFQLMDKLNTQGKTIILSTHDIDRVYGWADHVFVLKEGKVFAEGSAVRIFHDDTLLKNAGLKVPWIMEVYKWLQNKEVIKSNISVPRNKEELFGLIK